MFRAIRDFATDFLPWFLGFGPDVPLASRAETERKAARLALFDARQSGDTRSIHTACERLKAATTAALRVEVRL